jgi:adenosylcobinamide-GDP ribazoletransferase
MKRQLRLFFTALAFYSRLPVPKSVHQQSAVHLPDAIRYLPVVGWIAGIVAGLVYAFAAFLFGESIGLIGAMGATILLTGAFHEDGFADVCDGFGGGWTKEKILLIMKDSRLGTYGVVGLFLLLGLMYASLYQLCSFSILGKDIYSVCGIFIFGHTLSRFAAITVVFNHSYVRIEESKASGAVAKGRILNLLIAALLTLLPVVTFTIYMDKPFLGLVVIPVLLVSFYLGGYFKKWIGGYTGDCLGAVQQLTELTIYLSYILIWKFT